MRRTPTLTDGLVQVFDRKKLWKEYGIDNNVIVCPQVSTCFSMSFSDNT
jgi:hypothetical protein